MSQQKLVIVAHGIGRHAEDFKKQWEPFLLPLAQATGVKLQVEGLWWDDIQQALDEKYDISATATALAGQLGFPLQAGGTAYQQARDFYKDVFFYLCAHEMSTFLQIECAKKLRRLTKGQEGHTLLIGHSLGAAMLPHVIWRRFGSTGENLFHSLILLASPLGMCSPLPGLVADPLEIMRKLIKEYQTASRTELLGAFGDCWGPQRLNFINNRRDLVCAEVTYEDSLPNIPHVYVKGHLLPDIQKEFSGQEIEAVATARQTVQKFAFGEARLKAMVANHAVEVYLASPPFKTTFRRLLRA